MNATHCVARHEDFGDGLKTWAIYQITNETNTSLTTHLWDARTEAVALDIIDALTGVKAS